MDFSSILTVGRVIFGLKVQTIVHLQPEQEGLRMPRGPAKKTGGGFLNPAMANQEQGHTLTERCS